MTEMEIPPSLHYGLECEKGWWPLIAPLLAYCKAHEIEVLQVKEKFGGLRFYTGGAPTEVHAELQAMIAAAEQAADKTCEFCGAETPDVKNRPRKAGRWLKTLCDACWETW